LPPDIAATVGFFTNDLSNIRFPDISVAELQASAEEVCRHSARVASAAAALADARVKAAQTALALRGQLQRGLAYAAIYAEASPERRSLAATIDVLRGTLRAHGGSGTQDPGAAAERSAAGAGKRGGRKPRASGELVFASEPVPSEQTTDFTRQTGD